MVILFHQAFIYSDCQGKNPYLFIRKFLRRMQRDTLITVHHAMGVVEPINMTLTWNLFRISIFEFRVYFLPQKTRK